MLLDSHSIPSDRPSPEVADAPEHACAVMNVGSENVKHLAIQKDQEADASLFDV